MDEHVAFRTVDRTVGAYRVEKDQHLGHEHVRVVPVGVAEGGDLFDVDALIKDPKAAGWAQWSGAPEAVCATCQRSASASGPLYNICTARTHTVLVHNRRQCLVEFSLADRLGENAIVGCSGCYPRHVLCVANDCIAAVSVPGAQCLHCLMSNPFFVPSAASLFDSTPDAVVVAFVVTMVKRIGTWRLVHPSDVMQQWLNWSGRPHVGKRAPVDPIFGQICGLISTSLGDVADWVVHPFNTIVDVLREPRSDDPYHGYLVTALVRLMPTMPPTDISGSMTPTDLLGWYPDGSYVCACCRRARGSSWKAVCPFAPCCADTGSRRAKAASLDDVSAAAAGLSLLKVLIDDAYARFSAGAHAAVVKRARTSLDPGVGGGDGGPGPGMPGPVLPQ